MLDNLYVFPHEKTKGARGGDIKNLEIRVMELKVMVGELMSIICRQQELIKNRE